MMSVHTIDGDGADDGDGVDLLSDEDEDSSFVEGLIGDDDWIPTTFDDLLFESPPLQQDNVNEGAGGPAISDWEEAPYAIPTITIDKARREAWNQ
jgi:hypothetical protein